MVVPRQVSSLHPGFSPAADRIVAEGRALDDAQGDHRQLHRAQLPEGPVVHLDARSALGRSVPASGQSDGSGAILAGLAQSPNEYNPRLNMLKGDMGPTNYRANTVLYCL